MIEKKVLLAKLLSGSRALKPLGRAFSPGLAVINYHRVRADDGPDEGAFEDGVFGPRAAEFDRQMAWIAANTDVVSEADVIERLDANRPFGRPSCLVTFDDGYADNFEIALPILRRHRIPAIFFVTTGFVRDRAVGWWDLVAYLVKHSTRERISIGGLELSLGDRAAAIDRLIRSRKNEGRELSVDELSRACGVPLPATEVQGREVMTWEQIRECARAGISIGSHTHSHPVLAQLSAEQQRAELARSKQLLEAELGARVRSVAYPFGGPHHYGPETVAAAGACGYELAFSFHGGFNRSGNMERHALRRFEASKDFDLTTASILLPLVFA